MTNNLSNRQTMGWGMMVKWSNMSAPWMVLKGSGQAISLSFLSGDDVLEILDYESRMDSPNLCLEIVYRRYTPANCGFIHEYMGIDHH